MRIVRRVGGCVSHGVAMNENRKLGMEVGKIKVHTSIAHDDNGFRRKEYGPHQWRSAIEYFLRMMARDHAERSFYLVFEGVETDSELRIYFDLYAGYQFLARNAPQHEWRQDEAFEIIAELNHTDWTNWSLFEFAIDRQPTKLVIKKSDSDEPQYLLQQGKGHALVFCELK